MATAVLNPDESIAVVVFNPENEARSIQLHLGEKSTAFSIAPRAIQTLVIAASDRTAIDSPT
jgi:hypothetical protein